ncbi:hypothetical protein KOW79_010438 [Hemibagrus wyckioides]|uniref:MAPK regulated corepressor interacting protein 1 n=1 Tax=Hemibagrus wyckioides TaxID=337641 RepID=A0A9D3SK54_9TELE|nr:hypothetical protein KOW79_010438 [Hemibagrus wyckioides]
MDVVFVTPPFISNIGVAFYINFAGLRMVQNYKQTSGVCSPSNTDEFLTPAHEENVRFIHYTWQCVMREMQSFQGTENSNKGPQKYVERTPNPSLSSFTPVDLNNVRRRNVQDSKKS